MATTTPNKITIRDGLWAIQIGYQLACIDAERDGLPLPKRPSWVCKWCAANFSNMTDDFRYHAAKIVSNHSGTTRIMDSDGKVLKVNAAEFIVDSLFALDVGAEYLPPTSVKISPQWVEYVKEKSRKRKVA